MPNLSVIVPVYKVEKYLSRCIESILNQSYSDLELILIDDGSPDNCGEICDEYAKQDDRIVVIHKKNEGVSVARNAGLDIAKGNYIGFVDSDDFIDRKMYGTMIEELESNQCDLAICGYDYVDEDGNINRPYNIAKNEMLNQHDVIEKQFDICPTIRFGVWNKLYKKDLIKEIRFPEDLHSGEDGVVLYEYLKRVANVVFVHKPLYKNVERQGSATHGGLHPIDLKNALYMHKNMALDVKKIYPDIYHHAFSFYIDICLRYYNACKNDKVIFSEICSILKQEKINVIKCKDLSWKYKVSFCLKY